MLRKASTLRHHDLILAARTDDAAMAKLLRRYKGFFARVVKDCFPRAKRPPIDVYLGEMAIGFMHCVREWDETHEFTTYLYPSLRGMILRQRIQERGLIRPMLDPGYRTKLAMNSWRWRPVKEPRSDRRWNRRQHLRPSPEEDEESPEWLDHEQLDRALLTLHLRARDIMYRRLAGEQLHVIGQAHKISRERVRQIIDKAVRKLQRSPGLRSLHATR